MGSEKRETEEEEAKDDPFKTLKKYAGTFEPLPMHASSPLINGSELLKALVSSKARSLLMRGGINRPITVHLSDPLYQALGKIAQADVLAVPVLADNNVYCGFIDMSQLANYVVQLCGCNTKLALGISKNRTFRQTRVGEILGVSPPGIPYESSIFLALEILATTGGHRMPVVNFHNNVSSIVTQSMIIDWLSRHTHLMPGQLRYLAAREIKPKNWVLSVRETDSVLSAFSLMNKRSVGGLAVLSHQDHVVDVISVRDLRGLGTGSISFGQLWADVKSLKATVREQYPPTQETAGLHVALEDETFENLLKTMKDKRVHRVFVVRSMADPVPVNTISQTDLLKCVLRCLTSGVKSKAAGTSLVQASKAEPSHERPEGAPGGRRQTRSKWKEKEEKETKVEKVEKAVAKAAQPTAGEEKFQEKKMKEEEFKIEKSEKTTAPLPEVPGPFVEGTRADTYKLLTLPSDYEAGLAKHVRVKDTVSTMMWDAKTTLEVSAPSPLPRLRERVPNSTPGVIQPTKAVHVPTKPVARSGGGADLRRRRFKGKGTWVKKSVEP